MSAGWFEPLTTAAADHSSSVTLVEGSSFCLSTGVGNVVPGSTFGLFVRDLRILSQWILEVDGERLEPLSHIQSEPFRGTFVTMIKPGSGAHESTLVLVREREVGDGMRETITLRSFNPEATAVTLEMHVGVDFADLFEVKLARPITHHHHSQSAADATSLQFRADRSEQATTVNVHVDDVDTEGAQSRRRLSPGRIVWNVVVPARGTWSTSVTVESVIHGVRLAPSAHDESTTESLAASRARAWREASPDLVTPDDDLERTLRTSVADLGALRIFDPDHPERAIPAAGAPWFMALFGRDSLLTSWMALPLDPSLALGTVHALAEAQGTEVDPLSDEQPGRILHERRYGWSSAEARGGQHLYYGSADSTPLFVKLVGEMLRWGIPVEQLTDVMPAVDRALDWIQTYGDADGDGFVEYRRSTDHGLRNQGWKDSFDGINFAAGRLAEPPIALCEVQGYVYGAYLARAHMAREQGDDATQERYSVIAADLKKRFNETFWLPEKGWYAVALDADKRPVDALASNMGHCLWSGIVDEDKAPAVVERLMSPEMFSGWGVRTLATTMGAYNPLGYHNGSVWPHDNAIIAAGMVRYGFCEQARTVATGILDAAAAFGGRLPELFCGFDRSEYAAPVPFPTSCSPQAWAAAAPLLLMRSLFRLEPSVSKGEVWVAPILPERYLPLSLSNIIIGGSRVSLATDGTKVDVEGLPPGVHLVKEARTPLTALHEH